MTRTVYIDTSVIGGKFDNEFKLWTNLFFDAVVRGEYMIAVSEILKSELEGAPERVKNYLSKIPEDKKIQISFSEESEILAQLYIKEKIVGFASLTDCRHIATATVNNIEIGASWNFKHIVNLNKIRLYNGINVKEGYRTLEIRTPREILSYEN